MNFTMWELTAKNLDIKLRAAEARIAALEEALRPFSAMFRESQDDNEDIGNGPGLLLVRGIASDMTILKARDLRRARKVLDHEQR